MPEGPTLAGYGPLALVPVMEVGMGGRGGSPGPPLHLSSPAHSLQAPHDLPPAAPLVRGLLIGTNDTQQVPHHAINQIHSEISGFAHPSSCKLKQMHMKAMNKAGLPPHAVDACHP